ncbi:adenylyltransferase/cytidyltransferase family protein [Candidatus Spongiihabitans sp.]|uniref:adenylyltransferase/cytidyltransferase family protein n=1 Tax=Candidatus Spongiihabitans sp. TaxID=3101308 RepID=UPI003C7AC7B1
MANPPAYQQKICRSAAGIDIKQWVAALARPLVFTNGCFDILHRGHVSYLQRTAGLGASLVVGLNSDDSAQRLGKNLGKDLSKGPNRPINQLDDRMALVAALACVDAVVWFEQDTPLQLIRAIKPEVLAKGGDWAVEKIVGGAEVIGWGGAVHSIETEFQHSTTELIKRIRR